MTCKEPDIIYRLDSANATARKETAPVLEGVTSGLADVSPSGLQPIITSAISEIRAWSRSLYPSWHNAPANRRLAGIEATMASTDPACAEAATIMVRHVEATEPNDPDGSRPVLQVCVFDFEYDHATWHGRILSHTDVLPAQDTWAFRAGSVLAPRRIVSAPVDTCDTALPSTSHDASPDGADAASRLAMVSDADGHPLIGAWTRLAVAELAALPTAEAREGWLACHETELEQVRASDPRCATRIEHTAAVGGPQPPRASAVPEDESLDTGGVEWRYIKAIRAELNRLLKGLSP